VAALNVCWLPTACAENVVNYGEPGTTVPRARDSRARLCSRLRSKTSNVHVHPALRRSVRTTTGAEVKGMMFAPATVAVAVAVEGGCRVAWH